MLASQIIAFVVYALVIIFLCLFLFISRHKQENRNRNYLFRVLCVSEMVYLFVLVALTYSMHLPAIDGYFRIFFGYIARTVSLISIQLYVILSLDIYVAIKHSLRYVTLLPLRILRKLVFNLVVITCVVTSLFHLEEPVSRFSRDIRIGLEALFFIFRILTIIIIVILAGFTISARNSQRQQLANIEQIFGENAERLTRLTKLQRQFKDMSILNIWNSIFLLPLAMCSFVYVVGYAEEISFMDAILRVVHSVASPIITVCSQRNYRKAFKKCFRRQNSQVDLEPNP